MQATSWPGRSSPGATDQGSSATALLPRGLTNCLYRSSGNSSSRRSISAIISR